jgi:hypothetical protein
MIIPALSALCTLFALATDYEEGEKVPRELVIATWLALEDYDTIIQVLGLGPDIFNWRQEDDAAYNFILAYANKIHSGPVGPSYLTCLWTDDFPALEGLIQAYNDALGKQRVSAIKAGALNIGQGGIAVIEGRPIASYFAIKQQGIFVTRGAFPRVVAFAPGWYENGGSGWPMLPPHEEQWYACVRKIKNMGGKEEIYVAKAISTGDRWPGETIQTRKWIPVVTFDRSYLDPTPWTDTSKHNFEDAMIDFCLKNNIFQLQPSRSISKSDLDYHHLSPSENLIIDKVVPNLGKISIHDISKQTGLSPEFLEKLLKLNPR